jgi:membrane-bound lytic murein transglycosylase B
MTVAISSVALSICCPLLPATQAPAAATSLDGSRDDVRRFAGTMSQRHGFDRDEITALLAEVKVQPRILEAIQRPAERSLLWWEYRQRFLTEERVTGGVRVWQQHAADLARIEAQSGVPAEYLIAITGVETLYGRITGRYRVLDALATLGFDYPPRGEFFRKELEQFLLMTREEKLDPRHPLGSYAGAMGIPQFMPSSFLRYAVDGDGDGHRDLWQEGADVFASVGNYLREHGWVAGQPVLAEALNDRPPDDPATVVLSMNQNVAGLRARGYRFETSLPDSTTVMLIPAQLRDATIWRIGFRNFYAITRYNRSALYAMTVHDLAQAIAARYRQIQAAPAP